MTLSSLAENQTLQSLQFGLRRLISATRVLMVVSDERLVLCWQRSGAWHWSAGTWPADSCRGGQPQLREGMGELLADLLLECDVVGAEIELVLPQAGGYWRVLDGVTPDQLQAQPTFSAGLEGLEWPLDSHDLYGTYALFGEQPVAIACPRLLLKGWIDVIQLADLPLRRVDWLLTSALRGVLLELQGWQGDLAWLIECGTTMRLVLVRDGVPELDCSLRSDDPAELRVALRARIAAWQNLCGARPTLGWWLSVSPDWQDALQPLIDPDRGERDLTAACRWAASAAGPTENLSPLSSLETLALSGMAEDIYP